MSGMNWFKKRFEAKRCADRLQTARLRLQELEDRCLPAPVTVTVTIPELFQTQNPDDGVPFGGDGDFYPIVQIGSNPAHSAGDIESGHIVNPGWTFTDT